MNNYNKNQYKKTYTITKNGWNGKTVVITIAKTVDDSIPIEDRFKLEDRAFAGYEGYLWNISSIGFLNNFSEDSTKNVVLAIKSKFDALVNYSVSTKTLEIVKIEDVRGVEVPKADYPYIPKTDLAPSDLPDGIWLPYLPKQNLKPIDILTGRGLFNTGSNSSTSSIVNTKDSEENFIAGDLS